MSMKKITYHSSPLNYDYLLDKNPTSCERRIKYFLHMHNDYEILFFFDGNAEYSIENVTYPLKKNTLLFIRPMEYHGLHVLSDVPYERAVLNFSEQILNAEQKKIVNNLGSYHHTSKNSPVYNVFMLLKELEHTFDETEFQNLKSSALSTILTVLKYDESGSATIEGSTNGKTNPLTEIIDYINENPCENLNAKVIARHFFVGEAWLNKSFKTQLHISLKHYINQKKILFAQSKILDGAPIKAVAEMCNYDNYSTFYRQYLTFLHHEPAYDKEIYAVSQKSRP